MPKLRKQIRYSFTIQLYDDLKQAVIEQARIEGRSQSKVIAQALEEYLKRNRSQRIEIE